ncbi:hypothetical protein BAE44_0022086, partial [Dichanthelium oligosanthes]
LPSKSNWKRIAEHFHAHRTFESDRSANSLEHPGTVQKECGKFQAFYEQIERLHPSSIRYKEHQLLEAQTMFTNKDPKDRSFQFLHYWLKVRNCPKFQAIEQSHKRPRSTKSSIPCEGGAMEEEGDQTGKSETLDSAQASQKVRPIGRKEANKRLMTGGDAGPYKEGIEQLILDKEEKKQRDARWVEEKKLKEER